MKKIHGLIEHILNLGGDQNLERPNVERPIFRNFEYKNNESNYSISPFFIYFLFLDFFKILRTLKVYIIIY